MRKNALERAMDYIAEMTGSKEPVRRAVWPEHPEYVLIATKTGVRVEKAPKSR